MNPTSFYDDIADYYDLIYEDWESSMARQGGAVADMLLSSRTASPEELRILDVAAGIGTQSLPLAARGFQVLARDVSPKAIARLSREAAQRALTVDAAVADMRQVGTTVAGPVDAVIAFDNALPHLLSDVEIATVLRGLRDALAPGGELWISVRDYAQVARGVETRQEYGERHREGRTFRLAQEWHWVDTSRYRTTMVVEERAGGAWKVVVRTDALYYAVDIPRLLDLMAGAGFESCRMGEVPFHQPVLTGRVA